MGVETKLLMIFSTSMGRKVSLYISDPREDLTEAEIKASMEVIVNKNIFAPKLVTTDTTEYDLIIV